MGTRELESARKAIAGLRAACEQHLFADLDDRNLILLEMRNRIRVNLELIEALGALLWSRSNHSYTALIVARSSFEHAITTCWVLAPHLPSQWTARFTSVLRDEIRQLERTGAIEIDDEVGPAHDFLAFLQERAGADVSSTKPLPAMQERLKELGIDGAILVYRLASQAAHGNRASYQARYGWTKDDTIKIDRADEMRGACGIALQSFQRALYEFAHCATLDSLTADLRVISDADKIERFRGGIDQRYGPVQTLLERAMRSLGLNAPS